MPTLWQWLLSVTFLLIIDVDSCFQNPLTRLIRDEIVADYDGDEKVAENDYSWRHFDDKPIANSPYTCAKVGKRGIPDDIDYILRAKNRKNYWTDKEQRISDNAKKKWIDGKRDLWDFEDSLYAMR